MAEALLEIQAPKESVCGRSLLREKRDVAHSQDLSGSQIDAGAGEDRIAFPGRNVCPGGYGGSGGRGWGSG